MAIEAYEAEVPSQTISLSRSVLPSLTGRSFPGPQVGGLSHHLLPEPFNWKGQGLNLECPTKKAGCFTMVLCGTLDINGSHTQAQAQRKKHHELWAERP